MGEQNPGRGVAKRKWEEWEVREKEEELALGLAGYKDVGHKTEAFEEHMIPAFLGR